MITNEQIKLIKSLSRKTERKKHQLFVTEGNKNVEELLKSNYELVYLFATDSSVIDCDHLEEVNLKEMGRMSHLKNASNILAVAKIPNQQEVDYSKSSVVLDRVNDPGNLGTIIRTANWFGVNQIVCSENSVDCYNSKVVMSTMGSLFKVKIIYMDLNEFLKKTHLKSYAAVFDGVSLEETIFEKESNIIMGSESHGLGEEYLDSIENKVTILGSGDVESLNLSISFGIICSKFHHQRN